jgi:hypothetical protein
VKIIAIAMDLAPHIIEDIGENGKKPLGIFSRGVGF